MSLPFKATALAPAKLNLTLDIQPPRSDGYHELDSVVVPLSTADEVTVTVKSGARQVRLILKDRRPDGVASEPMPRGAENLAHRAGQLALDTFAPEQDLQVWITLAKRLPTQAGLGAGSSDAATVLRLVGEALGAPRTDLLPLAATLGSDVGLFLYDGPVWMRGRGELVTPLAQTLPPLWGVVARPASGVPTGPAYALLDALPNRVPGSSTERLLAGAPLAEALHNDFEAAILPTFPEVAAVHAALIAAGARRALLCGSGSAVFGLADNRAHAVTLVKALAGKVAWLKLVEAR